jgi:hypothetical protein
MLSPTIGDGSASALALTRELIFSPAETGRSTSALSFVRVEWASKVAFED